MDYPLPLMPTELYGGDDPEVIHKNPETDGQQGLFSEEIYELTKSLYNSIMTDELPKSLQQNVSFADIIAEDFEKIYNILNSYINNKNNTVRFISSFTDKINMTTSNSDFFNKYIGLINEYVLNVKDILDEFNDISASDKQYYLNKALVIYAYNLDEPNQPHHEI